MYFSLYLLFIGCAHGHKIFHSAFLICKAFGETVACFVRVPTEVVKQRMQTGMHDSISATANDILKNEGPMGLYRGYGATLIREIPFSLIQFPLYESLKSGIKTYTGRDAKSYEAAICEYIIATKSTFVSSFSHRSFLYVCRWICDWCVCCCSNDSPRCSQDTINVG